MHAIKARGATPVWLVSILASSGLAFSGWTAVQLTSAQSSISVNESRIGYLESSYNRVEKKLDEQNKILIQIAFKLGIPPEILSVKTP